MNVVRASVSVLMIVFAIGSATLLGWGCSESTSSSVGASAPNQPAPRNGGPSASAGNPPVGGVATGTGGATAVGAAAGSGGGAFASGAGGSGFAGAAAVAGGGRGAAGNAPRGAGAGGASNVGDMYRPVGTNPFIATRHDPFSTFAADVDTASYDIFRRDINLGLVPQADSVRLEEYVNNFAYQYPRPAASGPHPFQISLGAVKNVFERRTTLLRVGIQATDPAPFQKRPANVVFLIDVSGSMAAPDRLPLAKQVAVNALAVLEPEDTVSIVTYSAQALVRLPPTPVAQRSAITAALDGLHASGSTAGAAALSLAYDQAQAGRIEGGINHILLCTDGDFNVGPATTADLLALVRAKRQTGVTLTTLGFGAGNLNDQMMEAVSNAGNGIYAVISSAAQANSYVTERLLDTLVHVAKDMKIQVEFNPGLVTAYRLLGYEDRAIRDADFRNDFVDAGEVGAGHRVTALYELVLAGQDLLLKNGQPGVLDGAPSDLLPQVAVNDLVVVKVRYKSVDATDATPASEVAVSFAPSQLKETLRECDPDLRWAAAVGAFSEIVKKSPFADITFLPEITEVVEAQAARDADRAEFATLFARAKALMRLD